jgi:hypothetical protein
MTAFSVPYRRKKCCKLKSHWQDGAYLYVQIISLLLKEGLFHPNYHDSIAAKCLESAAIKPLGSPQFR